jgi:hypothetical protein
MPLTPTLTRHSNVFCRNLPRASVRRPTVSPYADAGSAEASAEIHAYMSARDMALSDAERRPSDLSLNRAFIANEVVESCLKCVRSPYRAQSLPPNEASRAQVRCEAVKRRIQQLRACAVAAA